MLLHLSQDTAPFDPRLNQAILRLSAHFVPKFIVSDDAPSTYKGLKSLLDAGNTLIVAREGSEHTIFGAAEVNYAFRAWHDWCHWTGAFDFSLAGESAACEMQLDHIIQFYGRNPVTNAWVQLLRTEVIGQRQYYERHRTYIRDQRAFARAYMAEGEDALDHRW